MSYQDRDRDVVDYEVYHHDVLGLELRGPRPPGLSPRNYAVCVGAAQTWGCFCERPFPALLQKNLGIVVINLGIGGAGPGFFMRPEVLGILNDARFVVLQVMSGRSESNSHFESHGHNQGRRRSDGRTMFAEDAWKDVFARRARFWPWRQGRKWVDRILAVTARRKLERLVAETRENYMANYERLIQDIQPPKILFWFSERAPEYRESYRNVYSLFSEFPHLINQSMVDRLARQCNDYVQVVSRRGLPQPLVSRTNGLAVAIDPGGVHPELGGGRLWTENRYYPSPEMHEDAAAALLPVCRLYQSPAP